MLPNRIDVTYTAQELADLDAALAALETLLARLPLVADEDKPHIPKMPDGAWGFILNCKTLAQQHLAQLPREYEDAPFATDAATRDAIIPRLLRLALILNRGKDGQMLLESDCWAMALYIRRHLKDAGLGNLVDEQLDDGMRRFFNRSGDTSPTPPPPPNP